MIKGCLFVEERFLNNKIFSKEINVDEQYRHTKYILLKELFSKNDISLDTQDITKDFNSDFTIYIDYQEPKSKLNYLIVREPPTIIPNNHKIQKLKYFEKVFTWNSDLENYKNIFKINTLSFDLENLNILDNNSKDGYLLVVSNKKSSSKYENYSKRFEVIDFFENQNKKFHLYGTGWHHKSYKNNIINKICNNRYIKIRADLPINYKGEIKNKINLGSKFLFQFAIENTKNVKGYISEKIFDCFFSGSIPIYSGSSDIKNYIPENIFINFDDFNNLQELIRYTQSLEKNKIELFREGIRNFFSSENIKYFDSRSNTLKLFHVLINDIKKNNL